MSGFYQNPHQPTLTDLVVFQSRLTGQQYTVTRQQAAELAQREQQQILLQQQQMARQQPYYQQPYQQPIQYPPQLQQPMMPQNFGGANMGNINPHVAQLSSRMLSNEPSASRFSDATPQQINNNSFLANPVTLPQKIQQNTYPEVDKEVENKVPVLNVNNFKVSKIGNISLLTNKKSVTLGKQLKDPVTYGSLSEALEIKLSQIFDSSIEVISFIGKLSIVIFSPKHPIFNFIFIAQIVYRRFQN